MYSGNPGANEENYLQDHSLPQPCNLPQALYGEFFYNLSKEIFMLPEVFQNIEKYEKLIHLFYKTIINPFMWVKSTVTTVNNTVLHIENY